MNYKPIKRYKPIKGFKELQDKWYKKLAESGFQDIEQDEFYLKSWSRQREKRNPNSEQATRNYYRYAGQFYHYHKFDNELEKLIWYKHSEGMGMRSIHRLLNTMNIFTIVKRGKIVNIHKDNINHIVRDLRIKMLEMIKNDQERINNY